MKLSLLCSLFLASTYSASAQRAATLAAVGYASPAPIPIAPGQVVTLFFRDVAPFPGGSFRSAEAKTAPLPTVLGGLSVHISQPPVSFPIFAVRQENDCIDGLQPPFFPRRWNRHHRQVPGAARRNDRCLSLGAGTDLSERAKRRAFTAGRRGDSSSGISRRAREVPRWPTRKSHGHTSVLFSGGLGRSRLTGGICRADSRPDRSVPTKRCDPAVVHSYDILRGSHCRGNYHDCRQRGITHHHALRRHTGTGLLLEALTESTAGHSTAREQTRARRVS